MDTRDAQAAFVRILQDVIRKSSESGATVDTQIEKAHDQLSGALKESKGAVRLETGQETDDGRPSLRVTCPTRTVISAQVPDSIRAHVVEFYLTRPRADGVAETRLIGQSKYRDGDGKWGITYTTERFARRPTDPLSVHAEVLDESGRILAAAAIAPHP